MENLVLEKETQVKSASFSGLELVAALCHELDNAGVACCHWKSNAALDKTASGENDLDLLIAAESSQRFLEVLAHLGFKEAFSPAWMQVPGIRDFYGLDEGSSRLVHVHAHFALVVGHDMTKNYHLPVETAYLASSRREGIFWVPAPEFEYILLVIRLVLKHAAWDLILAGQGRLAARERAELEHLHSRVDLLRVQDALQKYFPFLSQQVFDDCRQALEPDAPFLQRIRSSSCLLTSLRTCARKPYFLDVVLKLSRRIRLGFMRRLGKRSPVKRLASGRVIAVVGGDGSGKTTLVEGLCRWLEPDLAYHRVHMGKPPWSAATVLVRGLLKIGTLMGLYPFMRVSLEQTYEPGKAAFPGIPWLLREICTARDRLRQYRKARRLARQGVLVVCDRYPLPQLNLMDAPQGARLLQGQKMTPVLRFLIRLEEHYYRQIAPPDLLIVLRLDPEIAIQRKPAETPNSIRLRGAEIWNADWADSGAHVVDARLAREDVIRRVKEIIWSSHMESPKNKRVRIVELVGVAGSGKSTLARELVRRDGRIARLQQPNYKKPGQFPFFFWYTLSCIPMFISWFLQKEGRWLTRREMAWVVILHGWSRRLRLLGKTSRQIFVSDQGPVSLLAELMLTGPGWIRGSITRKWWRSTYLRWRKVLDLMVWMDAPDDVLIPRVRNRANWHVIKELKDDQAQQCNSAFRKEYRYLLDEVLSDGPEIMHFKTHEATSEHMADLLIARLFEEEIPSDG